MQGVEHSSVVEEAQPGWPEDMSHAIQKLPDEGEDASASWGRLYFCLMVELCMLYFCLMVELRKESD